VPEASHVNAPATPRCWACTGNVREHRRELASLAHEAGKRPGLYTYPRVAGYLSLKHVAQCEAALVVVRHKQHAASTLPEGSASRGGELRPRCVLRVMVCVPRHTSLVKNFDRGVGVCTRVPSRDSSTPEERKANTGVVRFSAHRDKEKGEDLHVVLARCSR
jgi:hypothetical protein